MLNKKNRADRKTVENIFKNGKFVNSLVLSFKFLINKASVDKKISFIVPKSTAKSAVKRNMLRRRGYRALQKYFTEFPSGVYGAFVLKNPLVSVLQLEKEVKEILQKFK